MTDTLTLIANVYSAFNQRDIDGAFALMSDKVSWPKASEGGRRKGRDSCLLDPPVERVRSARRTIEVIDRAPGKVDVRVHQRVKSLSGDVLSDSEVLHSFTIADGLINRMDLAASGSGWEEKPSSAFSHR